MNLFRKPYQKLTDEQLMQKVASGDDKAFSELYDRYADKLLNYFFKMLWKDREMAEDFVQELFMKVIKKPEQFDDSRMFKTWIYSIANNMCKNAYRHHEVVEKAATQLHAEAQHVEFQQTDETHDFNTFRLKLDNCLSKLDENKQLTFRLRYDEHCSIQEIATQLECSEGTVKSRLFYTLKFLNAELKGFKHLLKRD
ncbi:MAG: RNA polymerase sigma factor [Flavobacteriales bacterium]|nr:RNA polymerase sigma factor [Flavobacteriales bacterium]MDG1779496.1 RNA polymerase sigma factor [Flavobacteriales bacterium]MDG2245256.1 RNA polymerase sigma factor [Flavobacteriales bacterium]